MPTQKLSVFATLRLIAALTLILPAVIFSYAAWDNARKVNGQANERIAATLDILQEHALKSFQTVERAISETNEVLRGRKDEEIRAAESDIYLRLKRIQQALPQIEAIWAFDAGGRPLVSSTILPVPTSINNSDRSYFRAHRDGRAETFVSEVVRAKVGSLSFFVVSAPREGPQPDEFAGVIGVTVMPEHFAEFYRKLSRGRDVFSVTRVNGQLLARYPEAQTQIPIQSTALPEAIRNSPQWGMYTSISAIDGQERRIGYRLVPGFEVYVLSGIETASIREEFWRLTLTHLSLGLPPVIVMFLLATYALYRAKRFAEETAKREIAETALKQAQRLEALGQLTGGVAHDFNNLLMVVSGNVQRLTRDLELDERAQRSVGAIHTAVKRGTDLTRQLLSFARKQTHESRVIDLKRVLPEVAAMLQPSLRGDISVETDVADNLWRIKIDASEFELALLNLAVNARDAMPSGGRFTLRAANETLMPGNPVGIDGEFVVVTAEDTGTGVPADLLLRVFEPFFTTKELGKGTGLGLSQVYGFARQAGGGATIESEEGNGTRVKLYLPRSMEQETAAEIPVPTREGLSGERGRILLVEDDAAVADVTRGLLSDLGYDVMPVANAAAAFMILKSDDEIDAMLSDIMMPGGVNGFDLARFARDARPLLPVVLATGYSESAQAAAHEGFTILRKPYNIEQLRETIEGAIRRTQRS